MVSNRDTYKNAFLLMKKQVESGFLVWKLGQWKYVFIKRIYNFVDWFYWKLIDRIYKNSVIRE